MKHSSAMPVERRYASALAATWRGSREKGSSVKGSTIEKFTTRVLRSRNGSTNAEEMSGMSFMSDSWMAVNPRTEEPSNMRPSDKAASKNSLTGIVKCC